MLSACGPSADATERAAIAAKIDVIRRIPAADTEARLRASEELRRTPTSTFEGATARNACSAAFTALADGMRLIAQARAGLDPASTTDAEQTLRAAASANALLDQTEGLLDRCADALDWVGLSVDSGSER